MKIAPYILAGILLARIYDFGCINNLCHRLVCFEPGNCRLEGYTPRIKNRVKQNLFFNDSGARSSLSH